MEEGTSQELKGMILTINGRFFVATAADIEDAEALIKYRNDELAEIETDHPLITEFDLDKKCLLQFKNNQRNYSLIKKFEPEEVENKKQLAIEAVAKGENIFVGVVKIDKGYIILEEIKKQISLGLSEDELDDDDFLLIERADYIEIL